MKLLYLADAPYIHTRRWVEHFARLGHDCEVVSFRPATIDGARVTYVGGFEALGKLRYLLQARRIAGIIRAGQPDLVHALHLTSYGFLAALSGFRPLIVSAWGTDILEAPGLTPFHNWLTRYTLRKADVITATGNRLAAATRRYAPSGTEVKVVPYGVDIKRFEPTPRVIRDGPSVIGTVARLSREKGVKYLIRAFDSLNPGHDAILRIAGDGPERRKLEAEIRRRGLEDRVELRGWVEYEDLPAFLQSLDIFALPSLYEGFGVAAVEAAAMALPVVASDVHGIPDVVVDGVTGFLRPPGDAAALAAAFETLIEAPDSRRRLGEAGRAFVAEHYDWQENAALMGRLYEQAGRQPNAALVG